jgi:predicted nucleotide-binding protein
LIEYMMIRMARRPTPQTPLSPILSPAEKRSAIDRLKRRIEDLRNFEPQSVQARRSPEVVNLEAAIEETLAAVFGHGTDRCNRYSSAAGLEPTAIGLLYVGPGARRQGENIGELRMKIAERKQRAIVLLESAVQGLEEELEHEPAVLVAASVKALDLPARRPHKVFVVHGHDAAPRAEVARLIEKLGFEAIILHERPNKGRTLVTKFREEAEGVGFAVVLMTPDDLGKTVSADDLNPRARQNVVFELGFFIGKLGPERVAALVKGSVEKPSDFDGVVYVSLDSADWQRQLGQELQEAGYDIDWNKLMRS